MWKKSIMAAAAIGLTAVFALPAFAEKNDGVSVSARSNVEVRTASTTARSGKGNLNDPAKIACVGSAVAAREAALDSAMTSFTAAMNAAYAARASALASAYAGTSGATVKVNVKTSWSTFNAAAKVARRGWQKARDDAWKAYRTAAVACKAPDGTGDGSNAGAEVSGT